MRLVPELKEKRCGDEMIVSFANEICIYVFGHAGHETEQYCWRLVHKLKIRDGFGLLFGKQTTRTI